MSNHCPMGQDSCNARIAGDVAVIVAEAERAAYAAGRVDGLEAAATLLEEESARLSGIAKAERALGERYFYARRAKEARVLATRIRALANPTKGASK